MEPIKDSSQESKGTAATGAKTAASKKPAGGEGATYSGQGGTNAEIGRAHV